MKRLLLILLLLVSSNVNSLLAAITFISASTNVSAASGNLSVTPPTTQTDDILILAITQVDNVVSTLPAGWTIHESINWTASGRASVAWKRASGAEGAFTITHTAGSTIVANVVVYRGCIASGSPVDVSSQKSNASSNTVTATTVTTTVAGAMVIFTMHSNNGGSSSAQAATDPAVFSERFDNLVAFDGQVSGADAIRTTAGATGNATGTLSGGASTNVGILTALTPASLAPALFTRYYNLLRN